MNLETLLPLPELETFLRKIKESFDKDEAISEDRVRQLFAITLSVMSPPDFACVSDVAEWYGQNRSIVKRVLTDGKDLPPAACDVVLTAKLPEQKI